MELNRPDPVCGKQVHELPEEAAASVIDRLSAATRRNWMLIACCAAILCFIVWLPASLHARPQASALVMLCIFASATISNIAGFAFSAIAGAGILHLVKDPVEAVKVMIVASVAIQSYSVYMLRRTIEWRLLTPFLLGGVTFLPAGIYLLVSASADAYWKGMGVFLVLYAVVMMLRRNPHSFAGNPWIDAAAGALGGITGGAAGFPGAFVTIWCGMRGWDKNRQRAVYQPFILVMQLAALLGIELAGRMQSYDVSLLEYVPAALLGAYCGLRIFRKLSDRHFSMAIYALLMVSGVALVTK
ncbi:MAG TPA: sulfite exporter TauE/SafE family protein [Burkholderiales bacterium]|nr:sulfite exporter TauE/SafE family protein [Burkholderiales bacterium]